MGTTNSLLVTKLYQNRVWCWSIDWFNWLFFYRLYLSLTELSLIFAVVKQLMDMWLEFLMNTLVQLPHRYAACNSEIPWHVAWVLYACATYNPACHTVTSGGGVWWWCSSIDLKVKTEFNVPPSFPDCYRFCMQRAFCT